MSDEFNSRRTEGWDGEYGKLPREYFSTGQDYAMPPPENKPKKPVSKDSRSRVRRLGSYLAVAAISAVVIVQAAMPGAVSRPDPVPTDPGPGIDEPLDPTPSSDPSQPPENTYPDFSALNGFAATMYDYLQAGDYYGAACWKQANQSLWMDILKPYWNDSSLVSFVYTDRGVYSENDPAAGDGKMLLQIWAYYFSGDSGSSVNMNFATADHFGGTEPRFCRFGYLQEDSVIATDGVFAADGSCPAAHTQNYSIDFAGGSIRVFQDLYGAVSNHYYVGAVTKNLYGLDPIPVGEGFHTVSDLAPTGYTYFDLDGAGRIDLSQISYYTSQQTDTFTLFSTTDARYFLDEETNRLAVRQQIIDEPPNSISYETFGVSGGTTDPLFAVTGIESIFPY